MTFKLRTATAAVLLAISAGGVIAQQPNAARPGAPPATIGHGASGAAMAPTSSASAAPSSGASGDHSVHRSGHGPVYRSAFDGYRAFTDQPVLSWRESNDLVGRIGGWKAYAREAQGGPAAAPSPGTRATAAPGQHSGPQKP
jgi:hypothetical protein